MRVGRCQVLQCVIMQIWQALLPKTTGKPRPTHTAGCLYRQRNEQAKSKDQRPTLKVTKVEPNIFNTVTVLNIFGKARTAGWGDELSHCVRRPTVASPPKVT